MKLLFENHSFTTEACGQFIDMTDELTDIVDRSDVANGMALLYSPHTTCAVVINEHESGFIADFSDLLDSLVPGDDAYYRHDDLGIRTEGLDDDPHEVPNGFAHCRGALLSSNSQSIPIVDGKLMLGKWQHVFFVELDCARERKVFLQVMGE